LHIDIGQSEIFSLLEPNGIGKSTVTSMIAGLLKPTKGAIRVMGRSVDKEPMKVKQSIGVVPQDLAIYEDLNARENPAFWGKMYGIRGDELQRRIDFMLDLIQLSDRQKERTGKY
jgi:ABC-2 type transport system ATP-binding protein